MGITIEWQPWVAHPLPNSFHGLLVQLSNVGGSQAWGPSLTKLDSFFSVWELLADRNVMPSGHFLRAYWSREREVRIGLCQGGMCSGGGDVLWGGMCSGGEVGTRKNISRPHAGDHHVGNWWVKGRRGMWMRDWEPESVTNILPPTHIQHPNK